MTMVKGNMNSIGAAVGEFLARAALHMRRCDDAPLSLSFRDMIAATPTPKRMDEGKIGGNLRTRGSYSSHYGNPEKA